jgi:hypothetical protein
MPALPRDEKSRALLAEALSAFGAISTMTDDAGALPYRIAGALARHPALALRVLSRVIALAVTGEIPFEFLRAPDRPRPNLAWHAQFHGREPRGRCGTRPSDEESSRRVRL